MSVPQTNHDLKKIGIEYSKGTTLGYTVRKTGETISGTVEYSSPNISWVIVFNDITRYIRDIKDIEVLSTELIFLDIPSSCESDDESDDPYTLLSDINSYIVNG
jgi:hypothetical protein